MLGSAWASPIAPIPIPRTTLAVGHRTRKRPPCGGPLAQQSPKGVFPNMKPPSKQEAPIVRGDGANTNGEFHGRIGKAPDCRDGPASMHPSRPWGAGWGAGHRARGAAGGRAGARRAFSTPFRLSARQGGARALAPLFRQKQCTRRSSASQTHVSMVSGKTTGTTLLAYRHGGPQPILPNNCRGADASRSMRGDVIKPSISLRVKWMPRVEAKGRPFPSLEPTKQA